MRVLEVSSSEIRQLLSTIDKLPLLRYLHLDNCDQIQELPNLPSNLVILGVGSESLWKLPVLLSLKLLTHLRLLGNIDASNLPEQHLPFEMSWISNCSLLESFELAFGNITSIQMETSTFPHLKELRLCCPDLRAIGQLPLSLTMLQLSAISAEIRLPTCLERMEALNQLELTNYRFIGRLILPKYLKTLRVSECSFPQDSIDLSGSKMLQHLVIVNCKKLMAVRGVEYMKLLEKVMAFCCPSLKEISDLSKFERLVVTTDDLGLFEGIREIIDEESFDEYVSQMKAREK